MARRAFDPTLCHNTPRPPSLRCRWRRRFNPLVVCTFVLALTFPNPVHAATDGDLDLTFGVAGRVDTLIGDANASAVAIDASGRIVVAGTSWSTATGSLDFTLVRYQTDGTLDPSFGTGGIVTTDFAQNHDYGTSLAIDRNGRIVVAGYTQFETVIDCSTPERPECTQNTSAFYFALARYNADGNLDLSFGPNADGKVITDFSGFSDTATAVGVASDGKIVVSGYSFTPNPLLAFIAVARYNDNGTLDGTFGTGGKVTTASGPVLAGYALAIQGDRKIIVGGNFFNGTNYDIALARYNVDGTLDSTFGTAGIATTDGGQWEIVTAMALDRSGKIVVAGATTPDHYETTADLLVARYNTDGTPDLTFSGDGRASTDIGAGDVAYAVRVDALGRVVVAGQTAGAGGRDFVVARYKRDGSLDTTFGSGGYITTDFSAQSEIATGLAIDALNRIVAAGSLNGNDVVLARYLVTMPPPADLMLGEGADKPNTVNQGDLITYTITVTNLGPNQAKNAVVIDTLSTGTTFVSGNSNKGNVSGPPIGETGVVTWSLGDIANGTTNQAKLTLTVRVRGKTSVTNTATVFSDSPDPDGSNDTSSITTKIGAGNKNR
jgi:uncharacterized delta-60 repeat protein/uncharacterized repeat protein (TIGR01451 family)